MLTLDTGSNLGCRLQLVACTHRIYVYTYWFDCAQHLSKRILWQSIFKEIDFQNAFAIAGFINSFLSWRGFVPLSRLSFVSYLIHMSVMGELCSLYRSSLKFTHFTLVRVKSNFWITCEVKVVFIRKYFSKNLILIFRLCKCSQSSQWHFSSHFSLYYWWKYPWPVSKRIWCRRKRRGTEFVTNCFWRKYIQLNIPSCPFSMPTAKIIVESKFRSRSSLAEWG